MTLHYMSLNLAGNFPSFLGLVCYHFGREQGQDRRSRR
jgi:hypothetical protein